MQRDPVHFSPEVLRATYETGGEDALEALINGMLDLADASGRVSGTEFAVDTLAEMKKQGIAVTPFSMAAVLKHAFGEPDELLSRMQGRTPDELDEMLPGEIGDAAIEYLRPILEQD